MHLWRLHNSSFCSPKQSSSDRMTAIGKICVSCGRLTDNYAMFKCPDCGKTDIIRCDQCRLDHVKYRCTECGFEGP